MPSRSLDLDPTTLTLHQTTLVAGLQSRPHPECLKDPTLGPDYFRVTKSHPSIPHSTAAQAHFQVGNQTLIRVATLSRKLTFFFCFSFPAVQIQSEEVEVHFST